MLSINFIRQRNHTIKIPSLLRTRTFLISHLTFLQKTLKGLPSNQNTLQIVDSIENYATQNF